MLANFRPFLPRLLVGQAASQCRQTLVQRGRDGTADGAEKPARVHLKNVLATAARWVTIE